MKETKIYMIATIPLFLGLAITAWLGWIPWPLALVGVLSLYLFAPSDLRR